MEVPAILKNKWVLGGIAVVGVVAVVLYMRGNRQPPPSESSAGNALLSSPAMLYSPAGPSGGPVGGGAGAFPSLDSIMGGGSTGAPPSNMAALLDAISKGAASDAANTAKANDLKTLTTLGLTPGMTGSITHTANGTSVSITPKAKDPANYSAADIRGFIDYQSKAGAPINAASIGTWQTQYGVSDAALGAAYGTDVAGVNAWKAANPALSLVGNPPAPSPQPQTVVAQRPDYSDQQIQDFISAKQSQGQAVNAQTVRQWAHENNVSIARVGQAYGLDSAGVAQWFAANPG